jgi:hypothetical protein
MISCNKTFLADTKSLGICFAGVNRGAGTYQASLPRVSEISQCSDPTSCPAGQTASTKGGEECRRAYPRHGYSSPEVAWVIPTKLEASNDERYQQKMVWNRSPDRNSQESTLGILGWSNRRGCRTGHAVRDEHGVRGNDGTWDRGLRTARFSHDGNAQPAGRARRAVGRCVLRWNVCLDRSLRASFRLMASHRQFSSAAAIRPWGTLKMPCASATVGSQPTLST